MNRDLMHSAEVNSSSATPTAKFPRPPPPWRTSYTAQTNWRRSPTPPSPDPWAWLTTCDSPTSDPVKPSSTSAAAVESTPSSPPGAPVHPDGSSPWTSCPRCSNAPPAPREKPAWPTCKPCTEMEAIPLPDGSVDLIISNGVINLSARKARVMAECARVLHPGGRLCVSDLTIEQSELPPEILTQPAAWAGCVAGALAEIDFVGKLEKAGLENVEVLRREPFSIDDCALYPLFSDQVIRLMRQLIPADKQSAVAATVVIRATLPSS